MKSHQTIALFGEAQKGAYRMPHYFETLPTLMETLGHPPPESKGLELAIQTLSYQWPLLFVRVREEGFSTQDYYEGVWLLETAIKERPLIAIGIPGVGSTEIICLVREFCDANRTLLLVTESDLYDFLLL